jgi:HSP20 family protein
VHGLILLPATAAPAALPTTDQDIINFDGGGLAEAMLTRWDPFADLASMRQAINRLFDENYARPGTWTGSGASGQFPGDLYETADDIVLRAFVPGADPAQLELVVNQGVLTLKGYRHFYTGDEEKQFTWHFRGLNEGPFQFAVTLPVAVNSEAAQASYENGLISVRLPKVDAAKARRIEIKGGQAQEVLPQGSR